jgi:hypothetical protein
LIVVDFAVVFENSVGLVAFSVQFECKLPYLSLIRSTTGATTSLEV